jgi:hypothetical protein
VEECEPEHRPEHQGRKNRNEQRERVAPNTPGDGGREGAAGDVDATLADDDDGVGGGRGDERDENRDEVEESCEDTVVAPAHTRADPRAVWCGKKRKETRNKE